MNAPIQQRMQGLRSATHSRVRRAGLLTLLVPCVLFAAGLHAAEALSQVVRTDYYAVHGTNVESLRASMQANRPFTNNAFTEWHIDWNYEFRMQADGCELRSFDVRIQVRYTLPQWDATASSDRTQRREWRRYLKATMLHEQGHSDFGIAAANEMVRLINSRKWRAANRKELKAQVDKECERILQKFRAQEIEYDAKTDHGRTQGACLMETNTQHSSAGTSPADRSHSFQTK